MLPKLHFLVDFVESCNLLIGGGGGWGAKLILLLMFFENSFFREYSFGKTLVLISAV